MFENKGYPHAEQVLFSEKGSDALDGGIAIYHDHDDLVGVIDGRSGNLIQKEDCVIKEIYSEWVSLSEEIIGD